MSSLRLAAAAMIRGLRGMIPGTDPVEAVRQPLG